MHPHKYNDNDPDQFRMYRELSEKERKRLGELIRQKDKQVEQLEREKAEQAEEIERKNKALVRIDTWAKAYPLKVFLKPDFKKVAEVLKAAGLSLDAVSASNMRHVISGVKDIVDQALKGGE